MLLSWVVAMLEVQGVVCMEHTQVVGCLSMRYLASTLCEVHAEWVLHMQHAALLAYAPCIPPLAPLTLLLPS